MTDLARLRRVAEDQDAYGEWNTASAWNRYYAAKRAAQGPIRRFLGDVTGPVLGLAYLGLLTAPIWLPFIR